MVGTEEVRVPGATAAVAFETRVTVAYPDSEPVTWTVMVLPWCADVSAREVPVPTTAPLASHRYDKDVPGLQVPAIAVSVFATRTVPEMAGTGELRQPRFAAAASLTVGSLPSTNRLTGSRSMLELPTAAGTPMP